jgi:predicted CXXCH cytochrome family protein
VWIFNIQLYAKKCFFESKGKIKMRKLEAILIMAVVSIMLGLLSSQSYAAQENQCLTCHTKLKERAKSIHAAMGMGCEACHKAVEGKSHPDQKGSIILTQKMPDLCYNCHDASKFKGKSVHQPVASGMCTGCHDPHQSNFPKLLVKDVPDLCYNCHDASKFKGSKGASGHTAVGMCTGCHNPHSSNSDKILKADQPELCYSCHDKSKFTKKYVHAIITAAGCTSCHTPHISTYPDLLSNKVEDLCSSCHVNKDGRHIVALPGNRIHPISGVTDPSTTKMITVKDPANPQSVKIIPDPKNPGKPMNCLSCHDPHSSDYKNLFPTNRLCEKCHKNY